MRKTIALAEIFLMISVSFAFSIVLSGEDGIASAAQTPVPTGVTNIKEGQAITHTYSGKVIETKVATVNGKQYEFLSNGKVLGDNGQTVYNFDSAGNLVPEGPASSYAYSPTSAPTGTYAWDPAHPIKSVYGGNAQIGGPTGGALIAGVAWAATAYVAVKLIGNLIGLDEGAQKALENAALVGGFVAGTLNAAGTTGAFGGAFLKGKTLALLGQHPLLSGFVIAAVVFVLTYTEQTTKIVRYQCLPFEPPLGGAKCEECNKDQFRPCSEYRCKSLGQACQLLNPGTGKEQCAWVNPRDVNSPTISPWEDALAPEELGLSYRPDNSIRPPNRGVKIVTSSKTGCIPAFTPLEFGIITNEPAQCKIDFNHTQFDSKNNQGAFDNMQFFVGDSNLFAYNHTQKMRLPAPDAAGVNYGPLLKNDGTMSLYLRCRDANGNYNYDAYVMNFCVDKGPDTTPPIIEEFSIDSGSAVQFGVQNVPIEVYVNEPGQCKWSRIDKDYEDMENTLNCATKTFQINAALTYTCSGNLTGIKDRESNMFYFRCEDQPDKQKNDRNVNRQSKQFILKGSQALNIIRVEPNETITSSTEVTPVILELETDDGSEEGKAICYFSPTREKDSYISMFETNSHIHKQTLDLISGNYIYYFRCIDSGGNAAEAQTSFNVFVDKQEPKVTRVYKESVDALKIVTNEDAECAYSLTSCNFVFNEGIKMLYPNTEVLNNHLAKWESSVTYYIKCRDKYGNEPSPNSCSIVASAIELDRQARIIS